MRAAFDADLMIRGQPATLVGRRGLGRAEWLKVIRFGRARSGEGIWASALKKHAPDLATVFRRAGAQGLGR